MNEIIKIIQNVGFPIAITCYLLIRMEDKLNKLTQSIDALAKSINNIR